jgi:hypothetical protein
MLLMLFNRYSFQFQPSLQPMEVLVLPEMPKFTSVFGYQ